MTMSSRHTAPIDVQKFQFDDFDSEDVEISLEENELAGPVETSFTLQDMIAARELADAAGHTRGVSETEAAIEADVARLLERIAHDAETIMAEQRAQRELIGAEAVRLATLIARKVLPAQAEAGALQEIEALIARSLSERPEEPRLVIRVHDALLDKIQERLSALRAETAFAGKPVLLADPALKRTEVRIEWANGGVDWSFDNQLADIETIARRLTAKSGKAKRSQALHDDSPMPDEIISADLNAKPDAVIQDAIAQDAFSHDERE